MTDRKQTISNGSPPTCPSRQTGHKAGSQNPGSTVEILTEGQECPFCHFAKLKRDGDEVVCPICGYGRKPCT